MRFGRLLGLIPVLILCIAAGASQQPPQRLHGTSETPEQQQRAMQAVNAVRIINTAELNYHSQKGSYASLEELGASSGMEKVLKMMPRWSEVYQAMSFAPGKDILPGFEARLTTSGDKYTIFIVDKTDPSRWSLYSDQEGLIYVGEVMR